MMKYMRMIDANINRVCEGLRVLEDLYRFVYDNQALSKGLRDFRHQVRESMDDKLLIASRDIMNDVGVITTNESMADVRKKNDSLKLANIKRVQEGLRTIEETLKLVKKYPLAKAYEKFRYESYDIEKKMFEKSYTNQKIYLILSEAFGKGRSNHDILKEALEAGVKCIQYREKNKSKKAQVSECKILIELCHKYGALFIVNDHLDVALAVGADGIHVGQDDLEISTIRSLAPHMIVGVSTHNLEQAVEAEKSGADYIGVGPIFKTTTKLNIEASDGLRFLKEVSNTIRIPYVAIGGIKTNHVSEIWQYGASCAMITEIISADNITIAINNIIKESINV